MRPTAWFFHHVGDLRRLVKSVRAYSEKGANFSQASAELSAQLMSSGGERLVWGGARLPLLCIMRLIRTD